MRLEKWKRAAVHEAIRDAGLDPREFTWDGEPGESPLEHPPTSSYFTFDGMAGNYEGSYRAGEEGPVWPYLTSTSWASVMLRVRGWLRDVKEDQDTPDPWAELLPSDNLEGSAQKDTPFTADEQAEVVAVLHTIKEHAEETYALSEPEMLALAARLDYLEEAVARLGRRKWANEFARAMFAAFLMAELPAGAVQGTVHVVFQTLGHLFGHPFPELPPL